MPSVTSSTTTFSMDVDDLIEQACEPLGGEHTSAEEVSKARRTLNLLLIEMQNKNIPLSKVDFENVILTPTVAAYVLNTNIVSVLEATLCDSPPDPKNITDIKIESRSIQEFHTIPNKNMEMRPNCFMQERLRDGVEVTLWPTPNIPLNAPYVLKMVVARKVEDITASYQRIDLPTRYLPLLVAWFSYKLSLSRVGTDPALRAELKAVYQEMYVDTVEEDREKTDYRVVPGGIRGR